MNVTFSRLAGRRWRTRGWGETLGGGVEAWLAGDQRVSEAAELGGGAAEGELVPLGGGEVPVDRVAHVDAHAAVDVDRGVRDPVPAFGGPELRGRDLGLD